MKPILSLAIPAADKNELTRRARSKVMSARTVQRAQIVLLRGDGMSKRDTARALNTSEVTVQKWTDRYRNGGIKSLDDRPGRGRKPSIDAKTRAAIITQAVQPPPGRTRHSTRSMARQLGVSRSTVQTIWHRSGIKPHLTRTFKISRDKNFAAKFWDVVGLYLNPPENAVVFCCDEKTQCQALERTQPGLPLGIGHVRTATHDYTRHGTTTLFAALDYATGKIVHRHDSRHTHREWLAFLRQIDGAVPPELAIHVIADNYATHKHARVQSWLKKHPRFVMHYTPASSSWMNLVERFFGEITRDCIRDGSFSSVMELLLANDAYIAARNGAPTRIVWAADGESVLRKINSARLAAGMTQIVATKPPSTLAQDNCDTAELGKDNSRSAH